MRPEDVVVLIDRGVFPDAYRDDGQWRIPLDDIRRVLLSGAGGAETFPAQPSVLVRHRRPHGEPGDPSAWLTPTERRALVTRQLANQRAVRTSALSAELGVSQMKIRRDLAWLAAEGRLVGIYGGALAAGRLAPAPVKTNAWRPWVASNE